MSTATISMSHPSGFRNLSTIKTMAMMVTTATRPMPNAAPLKSSTSENSSSFFFWRQRVTLNVTCGVFFATVRTSILHLLGLCRPVAIRRPTIAHAFLTVTAGIVAVIVFSVDRVLGRWARTHVRKETFKRISPLTTDSYASGPVVLVIRRVLELASPSHVAPRSVFAGPALPVSRNRIATKPWTSTSATFGFTVLQLIRADRFFSSAFASYKPAWSLVPRLTWRPSSDSPSAELLAGEIYRWITWRDASATSRVTTFQRLGLRDSLFAAITTHVPTRSARSFGSIYRRASNNRQATESLASQVDENAFHRLLQSSRLRFRRQRQVPHQLREMIRALRGKFLQRGEVLHQLLCAFAQGWLGRRRGLTGGYNGAVIDDQADVLHGGLLRGRVGVTVESVPALLGGSVVESWLGLTSRYRAAWGRLFSFLRLVPIKRAADGALMDRWATRNPFMPAPQALKPWDRYFFGHANAIVCPSVYRSQEAYV